MYSLTFSIHGNPDYGDSLDWSESHTITGNTIVEIRKAMLAFQGENNVGGGNWGEATLTNNGKLIGYVSYNGRVWASKYWEPGAVEVTF